MIPGEMFIKDGASLRRDLAAVAGALGGALPRLWLN